MSLNQLTINHIKESEGLRLKAYPDPGSIDGKPVTIGYGTTRINGKPIQLGTVITEAQAEQYLKADLEDFTQRVLKLINVKVNDNQLGALVSFSYNIGIAAFASSTLLRLLNQGDYKSVPTQMRRWNKNDGKVMQGLVNRREKEITLWNTPPTGATTAVLEPSKKPAEAGDKGKQGVGAIGILIAVLGALFAFITQSRK